MILKSLFFRRLRTSNFITMRKLIFTGVIAAMAFGLSVTSAQAQSNNTNKNFRLQGTIYANANGCYFINDNCSGVNYGLDGDFSAYANGQIHCVIGKFVTANPPCSPYLNFTIDVKNISVGDCGLGTNCNN